MSRVALALSIRKPSSRSASPKLSEFPRRARLPSALVPEGDTIHYAARRIREVLEGRVPERIETPQRRHGADRWPDRLAGRAVQSVGAHGKHLFLHFEGDLVLHSHLRMTGLWGVYPDGQRWRRAPRRAWLVLRSASHAVVQFDGPVLELMSESRSRFDLRLAALGQDILGESLDEQRLLARLREDDPTRGIGDALLDQRIVAGIGNIWKSEACFAARLDPFRATGEVADEQLLEALRFAREWMAAAARYPPEGGGAPEDAASGAHALGRTPFGARRQAGGFTTRPREVYGRSGEACRRCGARVRSRGQGDDNRTTYWCPACQL